MNTLSSHPELSLEQSLREAIVSLESGNAQKALSILDQRSIREQDAVPPDLLFACCLARSVRAHALSVLDQPGLALSCLEKTLSLLDPESCLLDQVWSLMS